ncbi:hypothetical protein L227DRAFT_386250 [Lentinus tigrinus ALCF2SS1-6]|uniref:Uncharacterized protein n=1 Tax=Lentinus tigrinus ALCF2SS1-6 TaxID=1328759 RepID=A0A5C2SJG2_9APHY|nr:hypothetical protein L227DRAFT_386250 [Lentinus tigrinus ALCF2SS1-6]
MEAFYLRRPAPPRLTDVPSGLQSKKGTSPQEQRRWRPVHSELEDEYESAHALYTSGTSKPAKDEFTKPGSRCCCCTLLAPFLVAISCRPGLQVALLATHRAGYARLPGAAREAPRSRAASLRRHSPHAPPNSLPLSVCASVRLPVSNFHSASSTCCCCATPAEPRLAPCATGLAVHLLLLVPLLPFALAHGWRAIYDVSLRCVDPWAAAGHSHTVLNCIGERHTPTAIPIPDPEVPEAQKTEKPTALGPVSLASAACGMSNRMCWGPAIDRLLLPTLPTRSPAHILAASP